MTAFIITSNKLNSTILHVTDNCGLSIAGNNTLSDIALSNEILTGAYINQISWGCAPGASLQILRGVSIAGVYDSLGTHDYSGCGMPLKINSEKPLTFSFLNGPGYCIIELQKVYEPIISTEPNYTLNLNFTNQLFYTGA